MAVAILAALPRPTEGHPLKSMRKHLALAGSLLAFPLALSAQASSAYLIDSNLDQLFSVDLTTGAATLIASTLNNGLGTPADLAWRAATQEL
jgi:hypothetical protein